MSDFLTSREVTARLGVSRPTLRALVRNEGLPCLYLSDQLRRYPRAEFEAWLASRRV